MKYSPGIIELVFLMLLIFALSGCVKSENVAKVQELMAELEEGREKIKSLEEKIVELTEMASSGDLDSDRALELIDESKDEMAELVDRGEEIKKEADALLEAMKDEEGNLDFLELLGTLAGGILAGAFGLRLAPNKLSDKITRNRGGA